MAHPTGFTKVRDPEKCTWQEGKISASDLKRCQDVVDALVTLLFQQEKATACNDMRTQMEIQRERVRIIRELSEEKGLDRQSAFAFLGVCEEEGQALYPLFADRVEETYYRESILRSFQKTGKRFFVDEAGVRLFDEKEGSIGKSLEALGIQYEPEGKSVVIAKRHFPLLAASLRKEERLCLALQKRFDTLFRDEEDREWGIQIRPDQIGAYRIVIPKGGHFLKKVFSVHQLLLKAGACKPSVLNVMYLREVEEGFVLEGHQSLESILKVLRAVELSQGKLQNIFSDLDARVEVSLGRKSLTDLYQNATTLPDAYPKEHGISYEVAQQLQGEKGEVILAHSLNLSTYSDALMHVLERYFADFKMVASNGRPKTFLAETRGLGQCHRANIGLQQMKDLDRLFNQLFFMKQRVAPSQKLSLEKDQAALIGEYARCAARDLKKFAEGFFLASPSSFSGDLDLKFVALERARTFEDVEAIKSEIFQRLFDAYTTPSAKTWEGPPLIDEEKIASLLGTKELKGETYEKNLAHFWFLAKRFESSSFYQESREKSEDFALSWKSCIQVFEERIRTSYSKKGGYYNSQEMTRQALSFFERMVCHLTCTKVDDSAKCALFQLFLAEREDWVGCSEGLASKIQGMLALLAGDQGLEGILLANKKKLLEIFWEFRTTSGMMPFGYSWESATFRAKVDQLVSRRIGLGIPFNSIMGSSGYEAYVDQAESLIQVNLRPYDDIFEPYFSAVAETFSAIQKGLEPMEPFLISLGVKNLKEYQDEHTSEWRTYQIEQDLPKLVAQFLVDQKYLAVQNRSNYRNQPVYRDFLDELARVNPFFYAKRVGPPPQRTYTSSAGSSMTSHMSGAKYESKSSGSQSDSD